jgi:hypothetical protein
MNSVRCFACIVLVSMLPSVAGAQSGGTTVPSFGSVGVPSFDSAPVPAAKDTENRRPPTSRSRQGAETVRGQSATSAGGCTDGPALEPRDYTQPEYLGRPEGARARMCFYRQPSAGSVDMLQFYPSGHFVLTTQKGAGGFALSGSINETTRGTYGFKDGAVLLRIGYSGTSVSQRVRGAGSEQGLATAGQKRRERELLLPNCQRITVSEQSKRVSLPGGTGHPRFLVIDGERWEHMSIDCPDWRGWTRE